MRRLAGDRRGVVEVLANPLVAILLLVIVLLVVFVFAFGSIAITLGVFFGGPLGVGFAILVIAFVFMLIGTRVPLFLKVGFALLVVAVVTMVVASLGVI